MSGRIITSMLKIKTLEANLLRSFSKATHSWWAARTRHPPTAWIWSPGSEPPGDTASTGGLILCFQINNGWLNICEKKFSKRKKTRHLSQPKYQDIKHPMELMQSFAEFCSVRFSVYSLGFSIMQSYHLWIKVVFFKSQYF